MAQKNRGKIPLFYILVSDRIICLEASSARKQKKILRAFFCLARFATRRSGALPSLYSEGKARSPVRIRTGSTKLKNHLWGDLLILAGSAGFEPVISSVTGRRDNPFTTSPYCNGLTYGILAVFTL